MPAVKIVWGNMKHRFKGLKKQKAIADATKTTMEVEVNVLPAKRKHTALSDIKTGELFEVEMPKNND